MGDRVELGFRDAALRLIPEGARVLAAVSGGGDSVALLHLLERLASRGRIELAVAHLDHGLRRGSRADRRFVERLCRRLGLDCVSDRRPVGELRRRDESPEEAARRVRRQFLLECARRAAGRIALGHTLDDQAETVLQRLARGAGATALTGMRALGPGPFVRPLLELERRDLRRWLERRELSFREDPSNADLRFDRNRVRRLVVPLLARALNPRAARHLVRAADRLREDSLYLDALAERELGRIARRTRGGRVVVDAARLGRMDPVLGKRVARLALRLAGVDARRIASSHIEALIDLAADPGGRALDLPGGHRALRVRAELRID